MPGRRFRFSIDLAIQHPTHAQRFLAGIECDRAQYHSGKSARDRDRLRQEVLEGLGWTILRVWSTDWFDNPDHQARLLDEKLKELAAATPEPSTAYSFVREVRGGGDGIASDPDAEIRVPDPDLGKRGTGPLTAPAMLNGERVRRNQSGDVQGRTKQPPGSLGGAGELKVSELHCGPARPEKEPAVEPWEREKFAPSEARAALAAFRDNVIAKAEENWEPERSILRSGLIEAFVEQRVTDEREWFSKVPTYLRRNTNAAEKRRFFEDICEVVARING